MSRFQAPRKIAAPHEGLLPQVVQRDADPPDASRQLRESMAAAAALYGSGSTKYNAAAAWSAINVSQRQRSHTSSQRPCFKGRTPPGDSILKGAPAIHPPNLHRGVVCRWIRSPLASTAHGADITPVPAPKQLRLRSTLRSATHTGRSPTRRSSGEPPALAPIAHQSHDRDGCRRWRLISGGLAVTAFAGGPDAPAASEPPATAGLPGAAPAALTDDDHAALIRQAQADADETARRIDLGPNEKLVVKNVVQDVNGTIHTRYERTYHGLPVLGGDLIVHTAGSGKAKGVTKAEKGTVEVAFLRHHRRRHRPEALRVPGRRDRHRQEPVLGQGRPDHHRVGLDVPAVRDDARRPQDLQLGAHHRHLDRHPVHRRGQRVGHLLSEGSGATTINGVSYDSPTANGSMVIGIGRAKALQIWYKALTTYFTSTTDYAGACVATLRAAADLYGAGDTEYKAVAAAWSAVNVN